MAWGGELADGQTTGVAAVIPGEVEGGSAQDGVGYLILSFSPNLYSSVWYCDPTSGAFVEESTQTIVMRAAQRAGRRLGCSIRLVRIECGDALAMRVARDWGRFVLIFPRGEPDDGAAGHVADMFYACTALSYGWRDDLRLPRSACRFPLSLLREGCRLAAEDLLAHNSGLPFDERDGGLAFYLGQATDIGADRIAETWDMASAVIGDEQLTRAVTYLDASVRKFHVFPGEVDGIVGEPELGPKLCFERADLEDALVNAFKAIEALVGEPPSPGASTRRRRQLQMKLAILGVDPHEDFRVGPGEGQLVSLEDAVLQLHRARDEAGAHGSTPWQRVTYSRMMFWQAIAIRVVWCAVQKRCLLLRLIELLR